MVRFFLTGGLALVLATGGQAAQSPQARQVLKQRCQSCHSGTQPAGGLDFTKAETVQKHAARAVKAAMEGRMPPSGKLSTTEQAALKGLVQLPWSFAPLKKPPVPTTPFDKLAQNPLDRFLFQTLAAKGLKPAPPASRKELLRRVTYDLTGLPPTLAELTAFERDTKPGAYERVVDRLLASPAYGERWARPWLDVVRFGESNGYERNLLRENAWPYRDWVVKALNTDLPYARFVTAQLAGDVTGERAATGFLVAGCHDDVPSPLEELSRLQRASDLDDIVATTSEAFLGLTVGCARCHDHKFDPITQRDYYRLQAVFSGVRHGERTLTPPGQPDQAQALLRQARLKTVPLEAINSFGNADPFSPVTARFVRFTVLATRDGSEPCLDELTAVGPSGPVPAKATASSLLPGYPIHQIAHLSDNKLGNEFSWISNERGAGWAQLELDQETQIDRVFWGRDGTGKLTDRTPSRYKIEVSRDGVAWTTVATQIGRGAAAGPSAEQEALLRKALPLLQGQSAYVGRFMEPEPVYLLARGDVMQRGAELKPGALEALGGALKTGDDEPTRRTALAAWLTEPNHPLTWRVAVNRVWQGHFGVGLSSTASDFGKNGEKPSHPELLDWLARTFQESGGRFKPLHKLIVTSYAYRQSAATYPAGVRADADNRLLWRGPLRRLDAEGLWDSILTVSGKLDRSVGGPPYRLFTYRQENIAFYGPAASYGPETWRRGLYRMNVRAVRDNLLACFDCPETAQRNPKRATTVTPLQALTLLNGRFVREQAAFFAERVKKDAGPNPDLQIATAWQYAFGRLPTPEERKLARPLLLSDGLPALCRALFNANEFLYY